ncbi:hypothetical protein KIL84_018010 [Mauremys mutica]|uniref:Uncharacterized protein n=1 Tax=Mauremys mutica TaxID=74926 RepID=A0A9D3XSD8_9SAUR|nr:hypothetical protein KIL84_018010 [Mauremys mutica]
MFFHLCSWRSEKMRTSYWLLSSVTGIRRSKPLILHWWSLKHRNKLVVRKFFPFIKGLCFTAKTSIEDDCPAPFNSLAGLEHFKE